MLHAKHKLRWGRAWVAAALVCAATCLPTTLSAQTASTDDQNQNLPAATPTTAPNQTAPLPTVMPPSVQNQDATQNGDSSVAADSSEETDPNSTAQPIAKNLATGLPLRTVMSPLHWGHLSLLSFQAFEGYDLNYQPQQAIAGRSVTALQGLVVYSIQKARSSVALQYSPYVWFSQKNSYEDFTSNAVDLTTSHVLSRRWSISAHDSFQYSPNMANTLQSAFAADFTSNTASQTAFLSAGRKALTNNFGVGVQTQISEKSRLSFNLLDDFVRLGAYTNAANTTLPNITQTMNAYGGGVNWTQQWNSRTSLNLVYNYRRQSITGYGHDTTFNSAGIGFSRVLKPSLTLSLEAGPGWSNATSLTNGLGTQHRTTVQGSAELFKAFHSGGIAFTFYRNDQFNGIISNSYSNSYDVSFDRHFWTRWSFMVSGSYIQQEFAGNRSSTGQLAWGQIGYMLSRSWSVFTGYRYLNLSRNEAWSGPQQLVAAGIRWAWEPQIPHK